MQRSKKNYHEIKFLVRKVDKFLFRGLVYWKSEPLAMLTFLRFASYEESQSWGKQSKLQKVCDHSTRNNFSPSFTDISKETALRITYFSMEKHQYYAKMQFLNLHTFMSIQLSLTFEIKLENRYVSKRDRTFPTGNRNYSKSENSDTNQETLFDSDRSVMELKKCKIQTLMTARREVCTSELSTIRLFSKLCAVLPNTRELEVLW